MKQRINITCEGIPILQAMWYVTEVVKYGRVSNSRGGKGNCFAFVTEFGEDPYRSDTTTTVYAELTKAGNDTFTVIRRER